MKDKTRLAYFSLLIIAGCGAGSKPADDKSAAQPAPVVSQVQVAPHGFSDVLEAVGTAKARDSVVIAANVTERVQKLHFNDGQFVQKGQVLVTLQQAEQAAAVLSAKAKLRGAESQLARIEPLIKDGYATTASYTTALAARNSAAADVAAMAVRVADRTIRAPFAGVVGLRNVSEGLIAGSTVPILELNDISVIKLDFTVPETALATLRRGMAIRATAAAYPDAPFAGHIEAINSTIDPITRSVVVRALIPNPARLLKPGMLIDVQVVRATRQALAVPEQAVVMLRDEHALFAIGTDHTVKRVPVSIGAREPGYVEITSGIANGTPVVADGVAKVRDGISVSVTR